MMAEGLRSKTGHDLVKDDEKLESLKLALADMLTTALREQRTFIELEFAKFEDRLDAIKMEVTRNSIDIKKLKADQKGLATRLSSAEQTMQKSCAKLEADIAELEDRSIINLPEKVEDGDALSYISSSLPKWFCSLSGVKMEVMRGHPVGLERSADRGSRTLICKMLPYTDRDRILKAARGSREIRFTADYSGYIIKRRRSFSQAMEAARNLGFTLFLIYPAKLKLSRGSEVHLFESKKEAEDFLNAQTRPAE